MLEKFEIYNESKFYNHGCKGECYDVSFRMLSHLYLQQLAGITLELCHGVCYIREGTEIIRGGHAWVELTADSTTIVLDASNILLKQPLVLSREEYHRACGVTNIRRYSPELAYLCANALGHSGEFEPCGIPEVDKPTANDISNGFRVLTPAQRQRVELLVPEVPAELFNRVATAIHRESLDKFGLRSKKPAHKPKSASRAPARGRTQHSSRG